MLKTFTETLRHALSGPTMGTRWTAQFHTGPGFDPWPLQAALQAAVDEVDAQMSTWKPGSDLMRLSAAPVGEWIAVPPRLLEVLRLGLDIGQISGGAFDIGIGDVVTAWGFGPAPADQAHIRAAMTAPRRLAHDVIELGEGVVRKRAPIALDLNGVAKGYGVDRLAETLRDFGLDSGLVGIDGEMRAMGLRPDGRPWAIAVEAPDAHRRAVHSVLALQDAAVATSGDYRHWVDVQGRRLSHTMNPWRGTPLSESPASVTVIAPSCAKADGWATALMVMGPDEGVDIARRQGINALFLIRTGEGGIVVRGAGELFSGLPL